MTKKAKPIIEDFAKSLLDNDKLKNALCFNEFLRDNELTAEKVSKYFWSVKHEGTRICTISIREDYWWIRCFGRYDGSDELLDLCEKYLTEDLKNLLLNNIVTDLPCKNCKSFKSKLILGKMFDRICWCTPFRFKNPDGKFLEYAKEIVLINKKTAVDIATRKTMLENTPEPEIN